MHTGGSLGFLFFSCAFFFVITVYLQVWLLWCIFTLTHFYDVWIFPCPRHTIMLQSRSFGAQNFTLITVLLVQLVLRLLSFHKTCQYWSKPINYRSKEIQRTLAQIFSVWMEDESTAVQYMGVWAFPVTLFFFQELGAGFLKLCLAKW